MGLCVGQRYLSRRNVVSSNFVYTLLYNKITTFRKPLVPVIESNISYGVYQMGLHLRTEEETVCALQCVNNTTDDGQSPNKKGIVHRCQSPIKPTTNCAGNPKYICRKREVHVMSSPLLSRLEDFNFFICFGFL
jgi:hypothetical protein